MNSELPTFNYLEQFFSYFAGIKERTPRTIREYRYDLILFFRFIKYLKQKGMPKKAEDLDNLDISDIDLAFIRTIELTEMYQFVSWLATVRKCGASARARRISAIRSFFTYLTTKCKLLDNNPAQELELPKKTKQLPRYLTVDESTKLLATVAQSNTKWNERDFCILTLFLNCGLRLSELVGIDVTDIREDTLVVTGKGNKERTIYLNDVCCQALNDLLSVRVPAKVPDSEALFVSRNRQRISVRAVQNLVKKYITSAGLDPKRYSTHKLRHTAATLMYQYGAVDLRSLQQILGHSSIATTEIYTHVNDDMLHKAVESNPLNQLRKDELK